MPYTAAMTTRVLLLGCGKMGSALLQSWLSSGQATGNFVVNVVDPDKSVRARAANHGVAVYDGLEALPKGVVPDAIVLAVEPGEVVALVDACGRWSDSGAVLLSIAAGVRLQDMATALPASSRLSLIRAMPNIPSVIGAGMVICCQGKFASGAARVVVSRLLAGMGEIAWIEDEALMDAVTAVSGSGPAYVFHFIEGLISAGISIGLPENLARRLAVVTVAGAGRLALESGEDAGELRHRVATPGGTTASALAVLMGDEGRLEKLLHECVAAAHARSRELGRE